MLTTICKILIAKNAFLLAWIALVILYAYHAWMAIISITLIAFNATKDAYHAFQLLNARYALLATISRVSASIAKVNA
jgi:hypothetical protein